MRVRIDAGSALQRIGEMAQQGLWAASEQALHDCNLYCLRDSGTLMASALSHSDTEHGHLVWATPYARRRYFEPANIRRTRNPNASLQWADKAKAAHLQDWQQAFEKGAGTA